MSVNIKEKPMFPGDKLGAFTAPSKGVLLIGENKVSEKMCSVFVPDGEDLDEARQKVESTIE